MITRGMNKVNARSLCEDKGLRVKEETFKRSQGQPFPLWLVLVWSEARAVDAIMTFKVYLDSKVLEGC